MSAIRPARFLDAMPGASRAGAAFIGLMLLQLVVAQSIALFPRVIAIDFYQYWGVSAALRLSGYTLGSPYANFRRYHVVLQEHAARSQSDQPTLALVARLMPTPGFTGTPFLYMLFGAFPTAYTQAIALFQALQVLCFLAAVFLLGLLYRYPVFPLVCLALLLFLTSGPLSSDLRVGNLGCFQLVSITIVLALADRLQHARRTAVLGALVLTGLTLLALAKPNVALVAGIIAVHLWVVHGTRTFAVAAAPAALLGAAAAVIPCLYFRSWTVWQEWYRFVFGHNPYGMARPPTAGNYSSSLLLSRWLHADTWTVSAVIAAALGLSVIAVLVPSWRPGARTLATLRRALDRVFGNVHLAMAIAMTMTIALPLLFWYHYYVLALIPGLWLLNASSGSSYLPLFGLASLVLSSGLLNVLFLPLGWTGAVAAGAALSWVPLWAGVLLQLYATGALDTRAVPVPAATVEAPRAPLGPPARRPRRAKKTSRS